MNQLQSILFAGALYSTPVQPIPQTYYVANLSETDGAKCGEYISVTPMPVQVPVQTITPLVIPIHEDNEGE